MEESSGLSCPELFDDKLASRDGQSNPELAHRVILSSLIVRLTSKMLNLTASHDITRTDFNITEQFKLIYGKKKQFHKFIDFNNDDIKRDYDRTCEFMEEVGCSLQQIKSEFSVD